MTRAAISWPKAYIIDLYSKAVEHGYVWVQPITEERATSLSKSFYNARRRSDTTSATWMQPEYHLVTFGRWEQHGDNPLIGRIPVLYNALPDGEALPNIIPASLSEVQKHIPAPTFTQPAAPLDAFKEQAPSKEDILSQLSTGGASFDPSSFINSMRKKVEGEK